ncbi:MAG TPA: Mrp/NBP35 family ATP-binding protein [Candidatus Onthomonas avicola]|nr:Mrp/NBP35 family ATP-binding protein [Candidatus Onthomonas avicola]
MAECTHDCSTCGANCAERTAPQDLHEAANPFSKIGHVIGVVSGKGGVGKSMVTSTLAVAMSRLGKKVGILDADITGPSIPKGFGLSGRIMAAEEGMLPAKTRGGIEVISLNLLTDNETDPVVWRGPVIAGAVKQFWNETYWGDVDYLFVDMPPGTGDVPLTVFQSLPVDGIVVVTSPQDLVSMIVTKALKMAELMQIPVLGLIENFSYFQCPDCGKRHHIFGQSKIAEVAAAHHVPVLAQLPMDPSLAADCDAGRLEEHQPNDLMDAAAYLDGQLSSVR